MKKALLKRISRHTETLLVEWLKSLVSEEEADKVSLDNIGSLLPDQYHFAVENQIVLAPNSPKWIRKQLKRMVTSDPNINIESITLEDLQCLIKTPQMNLSQQDSLVL
jgi:hypothetical protein